MKTFLEEAAEFTGRACGIIARDLADISKPLGVSFRQGWTQAWEENKARNTTETAGAADTAPAQETL